MTTYSRNELLWDVDDVTEMLKTGKRIVVQMAGRRPRRILMNSIRRKLKEKGIVHSYSDARPQFLKTDLGLLHIIIDEQSIIGMEYDIALGRVGKSVMARVRPKDAVIAKN